MGQSLLEERRKHGAPPEESEGQFQGFFIGELTRFAEGDDSRCFFRINDFSKSIEFGPAEYPRPPERTRTEGPDGEDIFSFAAHSHVLRFPDLPPFGTELVVGFIAGDPDRPEVLKVKGWPE